MVTRIERPRSRLCVLGLAIAFLGIFFVLLGIGDSAPDVLLVAYSEDDGSPSTTTRDSLDQNVYHSTFKLTREHQLFWIDLRLGTGDGLLAESAPVTIELDLSLTVHAFTLSADGTRSGSDEDELQEVGRFSVKATQFCPAEGEWCNYFFLWKRDFVDRDNYVVTIKFPDPDEYLELVSSDNPTQVDYEVESRLTSINPDFTRFELGWKYFWLCITLLVMFCPCGVGFMSALRRAHADTGQARTYHQRWTATLLWALVWFDDPFVALTVYSDWAKAFSAVFIISASLFVFLILLFWLCFLTDLRVMDAAGTEGSGGSGRGANRGICYWFPKFFLTAAIGLTVLGGYMYYRFENTLSFDYTGVADEKKAAEDLAGVLGFLLAAYMLWMIILTLRMCGSLRRASASVVLLFFVTLLTALVAVIGVFVAAYYPYSTSSVAFVGIHGLLNLYVWTLAVSFSPLRSTGSHGAGMREKPVSLGARRESSAVTGTRRGSGSHDDLKAWGTPADSDFKAVEL